jgi:hypothetical protein
MDSATGEERKPRPPRVPNMIQTHCGIPEKSHVIDYLEINRKCDLWMKRNGLSTTTNPAKLETYENI